MHLILVWNFPSYQTICIRSHYNHPVDNGYTGRISASCARTTLESRRRRATPRMAGYFYQVLSEGRKLQDKLRTSKL